MKKAETLLIVLTLVFCVVMIGFLLMRSFGTSAVQISGQVTPATVSVGSRSNAHSHYSPGVTGGKININTATAEELSALPGIGSVLAGRIVEYRNNNGPFESIDDLSKVVGIGEKKLETIRPYVMIY